MLGQYLPIFAMLVLGVVFALLSLMVSRILAPRRTSVAKEAPYECGIVPTNEPPTRFPVRFFLIAMIFIVFDIEIIFLYPWATVIGELGLFGLIAMAIFAFAVFESFVYLIGNGALEWGPIKQGIQNNMIDTKRTASSTVRRIGNNEPTTEAA